MKKLTIAFVCMLCFVTSVFAGGNDQVFQKMGIKLPGGKAGQKFNAVSETGEQVSVTSNDLAVKVWFTDIQGNPYNPTKHRFNPKERFDIWICSNVPVVVSLFQNYQEDRPDSRLVYPVKDNPVTYQPLKAFVPVKIPVSFEMDDDMRNEIMSIVVSKGDKTGSVTNVVDAAITNINTGATQSVIVDGNNNNIIMNQEVADCLVRFNNRVLESKNSSLRFTPCPGTSLYVNTPTPTGVTCTQQEFGRDVCCILFGHGAIAQYQITLHK